MICCYDGDRAGRDAAWRALETALPYMTDGRQLRFMFLPDGEDPDTLVRKEGKEAFEARMEQALPLSAFLFNSLLPQVDLSTPDGRAQLSTLALPLITQVPGETLRIYLRQELGNKLGILDDSQLERLMPKLAENGASRPGFTAKTYDHAYTYRVTGTEPRFSPAGAAVRALWIKISCPALAYSENWSTLVWPSQSDHRTTVRTLSWHK